MVNCSMTKAITRSLEFAHIRCWFVCVGLLLTLVVHLFHSGQRDVECCYLQKISCMVYSVFCFISDDKYNRISRDSSESLVIHVFARVQQHVNQVLLTFIWSVCGSSDQACEFQKCSCFGDADFVRTLVQQCKFNK